ncbi:MAG TPA: FecR domain-containing protein [Terriglobales bacterium]|nr:FecR domain-containing protein [Terriglobales bacterium]
MPDENDVPTATGAGAISTTAAEWVAERRNAESWTPKRQAELDAWLERSPAHRVAYIRIEATWKRTDRLAALHRPMRKPVDRAHPQRSLWLKIGAALGLTGLAIFALSGKYFEVRHEQSFETPVGGREQVILADGTRIELNTNTAVRVSLDQNARAITLDRGEAFFQVRHDAEHPFVVNAGAHRVTDLGTEFTVRRELDRVQVALIRGRARFDTPGAGTRASSLELAPGDEVVASNAGVTLLKKPVAILRTGLGWRRGVVVFSNTTLADAVTEFNRYSAKKITFADPAIGRLRIEGTFQTNNIEAFADVLQAALGLHSEVHGGDIIVSRWK